MSILRCCKFFFFKQKTAYEMRISDWSSDVCSSDLDDEVEAVDAGDGTPAPPEAPKKKETIDRTDDPVRMYLREMGAVELLSREGEIAIAKRIEAGRDTMIFGLCESPITFTAIISWSNALNHGPKQLRDITDQIGNTSGREQEVQ